MATPLIVEIKRNSLDDGPGIRSVVFFKGCPLRCVWCQNPEAISPQAQLQRLIASCIGCRECRAVCPEGVAGPHSPAGEEIVRCRTCGHCVDVCPAAARRLVGFEYDMDALVELLLRDDPFYRASGGGVTFSGGEPTQAPGFAGELARRLVGHGVSVLLETCGHFAWETVAEHLLPELSMIYFDLKLADDGLHRAHTGKGNERIWQNLRRLVERGEPAVLPRIPLVPGLTDGLDNLEALGWRLVELGLRRVALLAYNPLWVPKRRGLGLDLPCVHRDWMSSESIEACRAVLGGQGLEVV